MAVILVLGLLAGAAAWSLTEDARRGSRLGVLDRIAHADHMARLGARRLGRPTRLRFDLDRQEIRQVRHNGSRQEETHTWRLPAEFRIARVVRQAAPYEARTSTLLESDAGVMDIPVSSEGNSPSYAVVVATPHGDSRLVFVGLTGQVLQDYEQEDIDILFAR